jgi:hypothetical protein
MRRSAFERLKLEFHARAGVTRADKRAALTPLAQACTGEYEAAFRCAPNGYERACVTAEWMGHRAGAPYFDSDSELLRSAFPAACPPLSADDERRLQDAARRMQDIVVQTLGALPAAARLPEDHARKIADLFGSEFAPVARINRPTSSSKPCRPTCQRS